MEALEEHTKVLRKELCDVLTPSRRKEGFEATHCGKDQVRYGPFIGAQNAGKALK
jgi:hypothetical protein